MSDSTVNANPPAANGDSRERVAHLKQVVRERAGAAADWAQDRAQVIAETAKEKPLATAGVSAGVAFAGGVLLGLLLAQALQPQPRGWRDRMMDLRPNW